MVNQRLRASKTIRQSPRDFRRRLGRQTQSAVVRAVKAAPEEMSILRKVIYLSP